MSYVTLATFLSFASQTFHLQNGIRLLVVLFSDAMNLSAWDRVSAQRILIAIITQWFMKDKRIGLKLHFNYTAGWVFVIVFLFFPSAHEERA